MNGTSSSLHVICSSISTTAASSKFMKLQYKYSLQTHSSCLSVLCSCTLDVDY
jgi:hypothetical protein